MVLKGQMLALLCPGLVPCSQEGNSALHSDVTGVTSGKTNIESHTAGFRYFITGLVSKLLVCLGWGGGWATLASCFLLFLLLLSSLPLDSAHVPYAFLLRSAWG